MKDNLDILDYSDPRKFLADYLERATQNNPQFSLRAFAQKLGVPASSLSSFINGKGKLSTDSGVKIALALKLSAQRFEYFLTLIAQDTQSDQKMKNLIIEKINSIVQKNHDDYQKKVQKVFSNLKPHRELKYAIENQLTFRVLLLFWDPVTNSQSRSFIERFYSNERQVACSGYHTYSADGTMASYLEEGLQAGDEKILQDTGNIGKRVSFDEKGFPTLHDAKVKILGTNSWMVGNFSFSEECCEMKGYEYSEDKPALKKTSYVRFNRI